MVPRTCRSSSSSNTSNNNTTRSINHRTKKRIITMESITKRWWVQVKTPISWHWLHRSHPATPIKDSIHSSRDLTPSQSWAHNRYSSSSKHWLNSSNSSQGGPAARRRERSSPHPMGTRSTIIIKQPSRINSITATRLLGMTPTWVWNRTPPIMDSRISINHQSMALRYKSILTIWT